MSKSRNLHFLFFFKAETDAKDPESGDKKEENQENSSTAENTATSASKNKKKNKSKGGKSGGGSAGVTTQTDPPSVPVSQLFPSGTFPEGQIMDHPIGESRRFPILRKREFHKE